MFRKKIIGQITKEHFWFTLFLVFLAGIFLLSKFFQKEKIYSGSVVVNYTSDGFKPERLVVKEGTVVVFQNESGRDFWPASDFYPQNTLYPDFDPKKFFKSGESWSFTFGVKGTWGYHDHLAPINKGVVIVTDKSGAYISLKESCSNLGGLDYANRQLCWYQEIKESVKKAGVVGALELFNKLYKNEPLFSQGCHDAMHLIGDEAYREYRKGKKFNFSLETTYCGYGFYHGFIEAMLYTTGDFSEVRSFCESANSGLEGSIESPNAIYSCYHGIGHSTFDAHNPYLWGSEVKMVGPAIETCERVGAGLAEEKTKQCVTGVFNALGIAYSNHIYNLKMNTEDPTWYCRTLKDLYKKACYPEVVMAWISSTMGNYEYKFSDGAEFIGGLKDPVGEGPAMFALASEFARLHANELTNIELANLCRGVKPGLFDSCVTGIELALLNWGTPGFEYKRTLTFCNESQFVGVEKRKCYEYAFRGFRSHYSKEKTDGICREEVEDEFSDLCLNTN